MFLPVPSESDEDRENSDSINTKIDNLEETLERKIRADSGTSRFMKCLGGILKLLITWYLWLKNKDHTD